MKEHPILFSSPMVRAILEGRKTQTRRIMKPQPSADWSPSSYGEVHRMIDGEPDVDDVIGWGPSNHDGDEAYPCKYGKPGDLLWVREAWAAHWMYDDVAPREIPNDGEALVYYPADGYVTDLSMGKNHFRKTRPSIHMPRWASRITLKITDVRVERLNEISREDAISEGVERDEEFFGCEMWKCYGRDADTVAPDAPILSFLTLWESINGEGSWAKKPWVWVIEFQRQAHPNKGGQP